MMTGLQLYSIDDRCSMLELFDTVCSVIRTFVSVVGFDFTTSPYKH